MPRIDNVPRTQVAALPSVSCAVGQKRTSPAVAVPVGTKLIEAELDGTAWAAGTVVAISIEVSENGGVDWIPHSGITASAESLVDGRCSGGVAFDNPAGNVNAAYRVRASIEVLSGAPITIAGAVQRL